MSRRHECLYREMSGDEARAFVAAVTALHGEAPTIRGDLRLLCEGCGAAVFFAVDGYLAGPMPGRPTKLSAWEEGRPRPSFLRARR